MKKNIQENPFLPNPNEIMDLIEKQATSTYENVKAPVLMKKRENRKVPFLGRVKGAKRND